MARGQTSSAGSVVRRRHIGAPAWRSGDPPPHEPRCLLAGDESLGLADTAGFVHVIRGTTVFVDERLSADRVLGDLERTLDTIDTRLWRRAETVLITAELWHPEVQVAARAFPQQRVIVLHDVPPEPWRSEHLLHHELAHLLPVAGASRLDDEGHYSREFIAACRAWERAREEDADSHFIFDFDSLTVGTDADPHEVHVRLARPEITEYAETVSDAKPYAESGEDERWLACIEEDFAESVALYLTDREHGRLPVRRAWDHSRSTEASLVEPLAAPSALRFADIFPERSALLEPLFS